MCEPLTETFPHSPQSGHEISVAADVEPSPQLMVAVRPGSTVPASANAVFWSRKNALAATLAPSVVPPSPPPPRLVVLVDEMVASLIVAVSGSALFDVRVVSGSVTVTASA